MTSFLQTYLVPHLPILPVLLPLLVSATALMLKESRIWIKRSLALSTALALVVIAAVLLYEVSRGDADTPPIVYELGNWPTPFSIVLIVDHLAAMMLMLSSILGFCALLYATARWDRAGPRFHILFLLMLMGVNGAFLTGDIFNLFVFFEVFLAASYGLALHGSGTPRVRAGLHYVTINVATSLFFLIGVALIYGTTGSLNLADLAIRISDVAPDDIVLLEVGAAILGIAFLVKAGIWPLNFWLPKTYSAAAPPIAAVFAILSKVGIYVLIRLYSLLFGEQAGSAEAFANDWLMISGILTIAYGTFGVLSSRTLKWLVSHYILISSGTVIAAIGTGSDAVKTAALFYLISSTLAISAFYLLIEPVERSADDDGIPETEPVFEDEYLGSIQQEEPEDETGVVIPATIAILGGAFIFCSLLLSGMPPLAGFIGKFAIIDGLLHYNLYISELFWAYIIAIAVSGLAVLISTTRAGIDLLWTPSEGVQPPLKIREAAPIGLLLAVSVVLLVQGGPIMDYLTETALTLNNTKPYIDAVLNINGGRL